MPERLCFQLTKLFGRVIFTSHRVQMPDVINEACTSNSIILGDESVTYVATVRSPCGAGGTSEVSKCFTATIRNDRLLLVEMTIVGEEENGGLSAGDMAGIIVGCLAGVALAVGLVFVTKKQKQATADNKQQQALLQDS